MKLTLLSWHLLTCGCKPDASPEHFWCCPTHLLAIPLREAVIQSDTRKRREVLQRIVDLLRHA